MFMPQLVIVNLTLLFSLVVKNFLSNLILSSTAKSLVYCKAEEMFPRIKCPSPRIPRINVHSKMPYKLDDGDVCLFRVQFRTKVLKVTK